MENTIAIIKALVQETAYRKMDPKMLTPDEKEEQKKKNIGFGITVGMVDEAIKELGL